MSAATVDTITYVGSLASSPYYVETTDSGLDEDDYGLDTLTRTYDIRPDYVATWLTTFAKGTQDGTFTWMYSTGRRVANVRGPVAKGSVTFKGLRGGTAGTTKYHEQNRGGVSKQQVTLSNFDGTSQRTLDYRAPWAEWRYVTTVKPDQPRHVGEMTQTKLNFTMVSTSGGVGTIFINPTALIPPAPAPDFDYGYTMNGLIVIQNSAFEFEEVISPKAGASGAQKVYTVLERNEARIVCYTQYFISQYLTNLGSPGLIG